jgi:hypothetical protein
MFNRRTYLWSLTALLPLLRGAWLGAHRAAGAAPAPRTAAPAASCCPDCGDPDCPCGPCYPGCCDAKARPPQGRLAAAVTPTPPDGTRARAAARRPVGDCSCPLCPFCP